MAQIVVIFHTKKGNIMKKLALVLFSFMLTGSTYAMNEAPVKINNKESLCVVTGAEILRSDSKVVILSIPIVGMEFSCLSGTVNAPEVYIETEDGLDDYVLKFINITTDYLEIDGKEYKAHGAFAQKNVPTTNPLSHTSGRVKK